MIRRLLLSVLAVHCLFPGRMVADEFCQERVACSASDCGCPTDNHEGSGALLTRSCCCDVPSAPHPKETPATPAPLPNDSSVQGLDDYPVAGVLLRLPRPALSRSADSIDEVAPDVLFLRYHSLRL